MYAVLDFFCETPELSNTAAFSVKRMNTAFLDIRFSMSPQTFHVLTLQLYNSRCLPKLSVLGGMHLNQAKFEAHPHLQREIDSFSLQKGGSWEICWMSAPMTLPQQSPLLSHGALSCRN